MTPSSQLQAAINLVSDASTKSEVLEFAAKTWAALHGETTALSDLACEVKEQLGETQTLLGEVEAHLYRTAAAPRREAAKGSPALKEALALLVDANGVLTAIESVLVAERSDPDAEIAAGKLLSVTRRKIFAAMSAIREAAPQS